MKFAPPAQVCVLHVKYLAGSRTNPARAGRLHLQGRFLIPFPEASYLHLLKKTEYPLHKDILFNLMDEAPEFDRINPLAM